MVTEPAHQVGAPVTTDATDFWTLYKETGKAAGVTYPHARNIAEKHGTNGDGWQAAIDRLKQAIQEEETDGKS